MSKNNYYSVLKVIKNFELKKGSKHIGVYCIREQFPLGCCHARTFHRVQGLSLMRYGIIFGPASSIPKHMVYVALSRGRKYKGIYLKDFSENHIKVDEDVVCEMARLRVHCQVRISSVLQRDIHNCNVFIMSHNTRMFNVKNYKSIPDFENVDVLFCAEVRKQYVVNEIVQGQKTLQLQISNFDKGKGQVMYVNLQWIIQHVYYVCKHNVDILYCTFTTGMGFTLTIVGVYKQIQNYVSSMSKLFDIIYSNIPWKCLCCHELCVIGDFNIQTDLLNPFPVSQFSLYEIASYIPTTISNTKIDYIFATIQCDSNVIPCDWSDHNMLFFAMSPTKTFEPHACLTIECLYTILEGIFSKHVNCTDLTMFMVIRDLYAVDYNVFCFTKSLFMEDFPTVAFDICTSSLGKWLFVITHHFYNDIIWFDGTTCHYVRLIGNENQHPAETLPKFHDYIDFFTLQNCLMPKRVINVHVPPVVLSFITGYYMCSICLTNEVCDCTPLTMLRWTGVLKTMLDVCSLNVLNEICDCALMTMLNWIVVLRKVLDDVSVHVP
jgi:hypothetical protein